MKKKVNVGKVFTSCFTRFSDLLVLLPDARFIAVTRTHGFKRGQGESADLRRRHIEWLRVLSPSVELHALAVAGNISWQDFSARYLAEMQGAEQQAAIAEVAHCVIAGRNVVLMCYEQPGLKCHRTILASLVHAAIREHGCTYAYAAAGGGEVVRPGTRPFKENSTGWNTPMHREGYMRFV